MKNTLRVIKSENGKYFEAIQPKHGTQIGKVLQIQMLLYLVLLIRNRSFKVICSNDVQNAISHTLIFGLIFGKSYSDIFIRDNSIHLVND